MSVITKLCMNCKYRIPIYKNGKIIAIICEHDMDFFKSHQALPEDLSEQKACGQWKSSGDD